MALTPEQIREKYNLGSFQAQQAEDEVTKKMTERNAKLLASKKVETEAKQQQGGGILGSIFRGIVKAPARVVASGLNAADATMKVMQKDAAGAEAALKQNRDFGIFGNDIEPILTGDETMKEGAMKIAGSGAEIASLFMGGGAVKGGVNILKTPSIFKSLSKEALLREAKIGSITGALGLGGDKAQEGGSSVGDVFLYSTLGGGTGAIAGPLLAASTKTGSNIVKRYLQPVEEKFNTVTKEVVDKVFKPSNSIMNKPSTRNRYYNNAKDAFATIYKYGPEITDSKTGEVVNRMPQNKGELLQAYEKTATKVGEEMNRLSMEAGSGPVTVDIDPLIDLIKNTAQDKGNPSDLRRYASDMISEVEDLRGEPITTVMTRISRLNEEAESLWLGRGDKSKARMDASVAMSLRDAVNAAMESTGLDQYPVLRKQYSSLMSSHDDLSKQVTKELRRFNNNGLADQMTNVFTGMQIAGNLVSGRPLSAASAGVGPGIRAIQKYIYNPDRYIAKAFKFLEDMPEVYSKEMKDLMDALSQLPEAAADQVQQVIE